MGILEDLLAANEATKNALADLYPVLAANTANFDDLVIAVARLNTQMESLAADTKAILTKLGTQPQPEPEPEPQPEPEPEPEPQPTPVDPDVTRAVFFDGVSGATGTHWNVGAGLGWRNKRGDWLDKNQVSQGTTPYATIQLTGSFSGARHIETDVTDLVKRWLSNLNTGLMLVAEKNSPIQIAARESTEVTWVPRLTIQTNGTGYSRVASADAHLNATTMKAQGTFKTLWLDFSQNIGMQFPMPEGVTADQVTSATLDLTFKDWRTANRVFVFEMDPPIIKTMTSGVPEIGLATQPYDAGLATHPDVYLAGDFSTGWARAFGKYDWIRDVAFPYDQARQSTVVRAEFVPGDCGSADIRKRFTEIPGIGKGPEDMYFRFSILFEADWDATVDGGKLPGIASTWFYINENGTQAEKDQFPESIWAGGQGGAPGNGYAFALRSHFASQPTDANPYRLLIAPGTQAAHMDGGTTDYGEWHWNNVLLKREQWYDIEVHCKLNSVTNGVANPDGLFEVWINGMKVLTKTSLRFRKDLNCVIQDAWFNMYHGGTTPPKVGFHYRLGDYVIAKKYIGPRLNSLGKPVAWEKAT